MWFKKHIRSRAEDKPADEVKATETEAAKEPEAAQETADLKAVQASDASETAARKPAFSHVRNFSKSSLLLLQTPFGTGKAHKPDEQHETQLDQSQSSNQTSSADQSPCSAADSNEHDKSTRPSSAVPSVVSLVEHGSDGLTDSSDSPSSSYPRTPASTDDPAVPESIDLSMGQKQSTGRRSTWDKPDLDAFATSPPASPTTPCPDTLHELVHLPHVKESKFKPIAFPKRQSSLNKLNINFSRPTTPMKLASKERPHTSSSVPSSQHEEHAASTTPTDTPNLTVSAQATFSPLPTSAASHFLKTRPSTSHLDRRFSGAVPSYICLPKTFPDGPIPTPKPALKKVHYNCYLQHSKMQRSSNRIYPVPCMACAAVEGDVFWKCPWCCLRVCEPCMVELDNGRKGLDGLLEALKKPVPSTPKMGMGLSVPKRTSRAALDQRKGDATTPSPLQRAVAKSKLGSAESAKILRDSRG